VFSAQKVLRISNPLARELV